MVGEILDNETAIFVSPGKRLFLKIDGFSSKRIPIEMSSVVFYLLEENPSETEQFLGELPLKWRSDEDHIRNLLIDCSKKRTSGIFSAFSNERFTKVLLSGKFELIEEKLVFAASKIKLRITRKKISPDLGSKIMMRPENEPGPKKHSCD